MTAEADTRMTPRANRRLVLIFAVNRSSSFFMVFLNDGPATFNFFALLSPISIVNRDI